MQSIYKYELTSRSNQLIDVGLNFTPLHVAYQGRQLCLWAMVNTSQAMKQSVEINIVGTGWDIEQPLGKYLGTVQEGQLVWHIFYK